MTTYLVKAELRRYHHWSMIQHKTEYIEGQVSAASSQEAIDTFLKGNHAQYYLKGNWAYEVYKTSVTEVQPEPTAACE